MDHIAKVKGALTSPSKFFIVCALVFGTAFAVITPPFQTPDEMVHFYRAYQISELNLTVDKTPQTQGGILPKSLDETIYITTTNPPLQFHPQEKYQLRKTLDALAIDEDEQNVKAYEFSTTALYPPVSYAPQVAGIWVMKLFNLPPLMMMYAGRFANLIMWTLLLAFAIRLMPRKKWALVALGLLPMALSQAASLTTDVMAVGLVFTFVAYVLKLVDQKDRISRNQLLLLGCIGSGMALSKQVMFVFLPLILLLPARNFLHKKNEYISKAMLILVPLVLFACWMWLARGIDITATFTNSQDPAAQLKFVLQNPHSFINTLWNTYFYTWGDSVTRSFIGTFGWMDAPLSELIVTLAYIGLMFLGVASTTNHKPVWLKGRQKAFIGLVFLAYWGAVNLALYLMYSPVGFKIVYGLQGRYFLPMAILAIPLLYGGWLKTSPIIYRRFARIFPVALLTVSIITIFVRYYVKNV